MMINNKGSISIFLSIIILVVYLFGGLLIDSARIKTGTGQIRKAIDISMDSVLAEYNDVLKEDYCLLALEESNPELLEEVLNYYLNQNLVCDIGDDSYSILASDDYFSLYDYSIEDIDIQTLYNLSENKVMENMVIEAVKYRIPQKFISYLTDYIKDFSGIQSETALMKDKVELNVKYGEIFAQAVKMYKLLKEYDEEIFKESSSEMSNIIIEILNRISSLKKKINRLRQRISDLKDNEIVNMQKIRKLRAEILEIKKEIYELEKELKVLKDQLEELILEQQIAVKQILDCSIGIQRIFSECRHIKDNIDEEFSAISSQSLKDSIFNELSIYEKGLNIIAIEIIERNEEKNLGIIEEMLSSYKKEKYLMISTLSADYIKNQINEDFLKKKKRRKEYDNILELQESINDYFGSQFKSENYNLKRMLPSYRDIFGNYPNKIMSDEYKGEYLKEYKFSKEACNVLKSMDMENGDSTLEIFDLKNNFLVDLVKYSGKSLYINEYILGMFNNTVSEKNNEQDLLGRDITKRSKYFKQSEVEYIISGNLDEETSKVMTERSIAVIRFSLNFLHLYKDPKKNKLAMELAMASGSGVAIPIIHTVILSIWAGIETKKDMDKLMNGDSVPFIKTSKDWSTNLKECTTKKIAQIQKKNSVESIKTSRTNYSKTLLDKIGEFNNFYYKDYLRILLMSKTINVKLNRIEDVIQLNMSKTNKDYKICNSSTYICAETKVSIKKLFPDILKTFKRNTENRYSYNYVLYKGY